MSMTKLTVLIAEDDSVTVLSLKDMLLRMGHTVAGAARDGREAVQMAEEIEPDLILMDIKMPRLDGIEAASTIMTERPTPIIILTAYSGESLIERASAAGVSTYLVKPIDENSLRAAIRLAVDRFEERQALAAEVSRMKESLETRKLVDKAKWLLVTQRGISEEEAHQNIAQLSRQWNLKIGEVARVIISEKGSKDVLKGKMELTK